MKKIALVLALATGCSPLYTATTKRCPTTPLALVDFFLGTALLAVSVNAHVDHDQVKSLAYATSGMGVIMGSHFAEAKCARR